MLLPDVSNARLQLSSQTFWGCLWLPVAGTAFAAGSGNQSTDPEKGTEKEKRNEKLEWS